MTHFIKIGGVLVITAVLGIFLYILIQIVPLFQGAKVKELATVALPKAEYPLVGSDESALLPFVVQPQGKLLFIDVEAGGATSEVDLGIIPPAAEGAAPPSISALNYSDRRQELIFALSNGTVSIVPLNYSVDFSAGKGKVVQNAKANEAIPLGNPGAAIAEIDFGDSGDAKLIAGIQQIGDQAELHAVRMTRKRSLIGAGKLVVDKTYNLTPLLKGKPVGLLVSSQADSVIVLTTEGDIQYFFRSGEEFELRQSFRPFGDLADPTVASMNFLFGDVSLVLSSASGVNRVFSLLRPEGSDTRTFVQTKQFPELPGAASFYAGSLRNKAFLTGAGKFASLRFSTTEEIRWEEELPFTVAQARISGKYHRLLFLDTESKLHLFDLQDPHPETSFKALFAKVWYEGYSEPSYQWQSTGGSDEFEPKLSLAPLIVGTLKGTFYAMLFAVPVALLAALYTSQFLTAKYKTVIKPTMEIMASLPSVVLGFLAALWVAPLIEQRVPSLLLLVVLLPLAAVSIGFGWSSLPYRKRRMIPAGYEFFVFLPVLVLVFYVSWEFGPTLEKYLFVVTDPLTGHKIADFRLWWPSVTGASYEQRNSLVVGFMMGFAVIPIIFTIAEDALSNVPDTLRSASLALGGSRWQTAMRIVVPTASAGIFSALMIGLGRAVGETMIVVMATGNTPVMDLNIFSGMRTLSANIAVELPEAPHHSTLYRTLFLGAMLLFLMTFFVNTVAEILRQRLREKYKTV
ncbi:MAG TPA: ABC transporter permease subunit [Chthoniobacteraceae bacterium]|jgi:phosphate transport system permease protein